MSLNSLHTRGRELTKSRPVYSILLDKEKPSQKGCTVFILTSTSVHSTVHAMVSKQRASHNFAQPRQAFILKISTFPKARNLSGENWASKDLPRDSRDRRHMQVICRFE